MKTRTLLLLALACGLAIMIAGAVFLFMLSNQEPVAEPVPLGEPARVGDMTVTVERARPVGDGLVVEVRIGGVDDSDGADGFRLIAAGSEVPRLASSDDDACGATTVTERSCSVVFDVSGSEGTSRVLFYDRGDERARWVLT